jgi:hypothetical protein
MAPSLSENSRFESKESFLASTPEETARSKETLSEPALSSKTQWRAITGLIILLLANLLNYMDRYTIAGTLSFMIRNYDFALSFFYV